MKIWTNRFFSESLENKTNGREGYGKSGEQVVQETYGIEINRGEGYGKSGGKNW